MRRAGTQEGDFSGILSASELVGTNGSAAVGGIGRKNLAVAIRAAWGRSVEVMIGETHTFEPFSTPFERCHRFVKLVYYFLWLAPIGLMPGEDVSPLLHIAFRFGYLSSCVVGLAHEYTGGLECLFCHGK